MSTYSARVRRTLTCLTLAALIAVAAASAASLDPRALVLQRGDLIGAWIPSANNGYRTADQAAQGAPPGTAARLLKYGFRRGYDASYGARAALVGSTVYVFGTPSGAKRALGIYRETAPAGTKPIAFARVGEASLGFRSTGRPKFTALVWVNGRVLSILLTAGLLDKDILTFAKTQSRRVAAAVG
jgi:hypothetical protein